MYDFFARRGPVAPVVFTMLSGLLLLFVFRCALSAVYYSRLKDTAGAWKLMPVGVRMDLILLSYAMLLPAVILLLFPKRWILRFKNGLAFWFAALMSLVVYMEVATFPFMEEYDLRPDQKFFEYLKHSTEVVSMLFKVYKLELALGCLAIAVCFSFFWKANLGLIKNYQEWSWRGRALIGPVVLFLLFCAARSSISPRPANLSTAAFSNNHLANELALNSTYTALYAAYRYYRHEDDGTSSYPKMAADEVVSRVKRKLTFSSHEAEGIPFVHRQDSPFSYHRPPNVVVFLQESMGASDVGCLSGPPITPNLCRLKEEGMWFSNMYATGTRTVRGIEAVVSGFLPTPAVGVVKLEKAKRNFVTAPALFKKQGYRTQFFYGGMSNFDEMRTFFLGNGVEEIYDEPTFENPVFRGTWGVSDEDLVRKAHDVFSKSEKPFFALMLSTSNHTPYEFPDGRIELYEQPKGTHFNAIKYADYAIGLLFELAKQEPYYANTLFLVVADHNSHVRGNDLVPISKYHIPALLIGPNVPRKTIDLLASQIDLTPTVLHFSGLDTLHPMVGRNLADLAPGTAGRAFMQFADHNAYRVEDQVIILRPNLPAQQFTYREENLVPGKLNPEMALDALAFAHLPGILYSNRLYRFPTGI